MAQYDELNQGLLRVTVKASKPAEDFTWGQTVLFGAGDIGTDQDYINLDAEVGEVVLPDEAVKGLDPQRINYGVSFDTKHVASMYFFPEDTIDFSAAKNRLFGEPLDEPWTTEKRMLALAVKKRDAMAQGMRAKTEALCFDCALNGKFVTKNDGEQKFPIDASLLALSGANLITKPFETISNVAKTLFEHGVILSRVVLNPTDGINLTSGSAWQNLCDKKKVIAGEIAPQTVQANGMAKLGTMIGVISGPVEILSYAGFYKNGSTIVNYIPQGKALMLPATPIGHMGYTGVLVDNGNDVQGKVATKELYTIYSVKKGNLVTTKIQGQSAPAPLTTAIDGYGVLTGIPTV